MQVEEYNKKIDDWEYCYCTSCQKIRYSSELVATKKGIKCKKCGSYELEEPGWIRCPYERANGPVKCPRAGKGIVEGEQGTECVYHCAYRKNTEE